MSGPKCGELSFELPLLSNAFDQLANTVEGTASAVHGVGSALYGVAEDLNQKRKQYIIDQKIAALKLKIHAQLTCLEELHSSAERIGDDRPYSEVVDVPAFSEMKTPKEFEDGLSELEGIVKEYRSQIAEFFENKVLEEKAGLKDLSQIASKETGSFVTANAVINSIENETTFTADKKEQRIIGRYGEKAQELFASSAEKYPDSAIPPSILKLASKLLSSKNKAQAQKCFDQITSQLEVREIELKQAAAEKARIEQQEQKNNINSMVGMLITATFEEMGYEVSGIEETCYVKNGEIFAQHSKYPGHAIKLSLDKENVHSISSEPVRLESEGEGYEVESMGDEFDEFWCSRDQLGEFRKRLKAKNLNLSLKPVRKSKADKKVKKELPESIRDKKAYSKKLDRLLSQTNTPRQRER